MSKKVRYQILIEDLKTMEKCKLIARNILGFEKKKRMCIAFNALTKRDKKKTSQVLNGTKAPAQKLFKCE